MEAFNYLNIGLVYDQVFNCKKYNLENQSTAIELRMDQDKIVS